MGVCLCRPETDVTEDPNVILYNKVGTALLIHKWMGPEILSEICDGLLYVKDSHLYHESTMGDIMCCKCCRHSWKLASVKQIILVQNETLYYPAYKRTLVVSLNPGIIISLKCGNTIVAEMPEAAEFTSQLGSYINSS